MRVTGLRRNYNRPKSRYPRSRTSTGGKKRHWWTVIRTKKKTWQRVWTKSWKKLSRTRKIKITKTRIKYWNWRIIYLSCDSNLISKKLKYNLSISLIPTWRTLTSNTKRGRKNYSIPSIRNKRKSLSSGNAILSKPLKWKRLYSNRERSLSKKFKLWKNNCWLKLFFYKSIPRIEVNLRKKSHWLLNNSKAATKEIYRKLWYKKKSWINSYKCYNKDIERNHKG